MGFLYVQASVNGGKVYERLAEFVKGTVFAVTGIEVNPVKLQRHPRHVGPDHVSKREIPGCQPSHAAARCRVFGRLPPSVSSQRKILGRRPPGVSSQVSLFHRELIEGTEAEIRPFTEKGFLYVQASVNGARLAAMEGLITGSFASHSRMAI